MPKQVEEMMEQAETYARQALDKLRPSRGRQDNSFVPCNEQEKLVVRLKTHFLFPQLEEWQRSLLVTLFWQRKALSLLINSLPRQLTPALQTQVEQLLGQWEQSYMYLADTTRQHVLSSKVTPVQSAIFEQEYVRIQFVESGG